MRLNCIDSGGLSCQQALHFEWRESARVSVEAASGGGKGDLSFLSCDSFRARLSSDLSRLPQVESLFIGCARLTPKKERKKKLVGPNDRPMRLVKKERKKSRTLKYHFSLKQMT